MAYEILWKIHAFLMTTSFLALLSGIIISLFFKKKKWRFKTHKRLGIYAGVSVAAALLIALIMVHIFNGVHFTSIHAYFGGITGLLLLLTPILGLRIQKVKNKKRMKIIHRTIGYGIAFLMPLTILFGLMLMGIIPMPA